ncbi:MAG: hypothetical protein P4L50_20755 [Anaerolineaceae bacterium]|nr:hypothetical protein [Anaerolineaceae bacterium]
MQIEAELSKGEAARTNGNEGMARVCARRAAGLLVRNYLTNQHIPFPNGTAYDLLKFYRDNPEISTEIQQVLDHLIARVDTEHNLPDNVDLIKETRWLIQALMQ